MSADKYPSIFSRQMKAIVYLFVNLMKKYKWQIILYLNQNIYNNANTII